MALGVAVLGAGAVASAVVGAAGTGGALATVGAVAVAAWAVAATVLAVRPAGAVGLAVWSVLVAAAGAAIVWGGEPWLGFLVAAGTALVLSLPLGRLAGATRWAVVVVSIGGAVEVAVSGDPAPTVGLALLVGVDAVAASVGFWQRCRGASEIERARLQLAGWAALVVATSAVVVVVLGVLVGRPSVPLAWVVGVSIVVPAALLAGSVESARRVASDLLVWSIGVAGMVLVVGAAYLIVVVGLGHAPRADERSILGLSMVAAATGIALAVPARRRLVRSAYERISGDQHASSEALRTFSGRMSRAIPMDELQLQLVELLRSSLVLRRAEFWTGKGGVLDRAASVPHQGPARLVLDDDELDVVARAHVSGPAWLQIWIPDLLEGREGPVRVTSVAHQGELLGLIVAERPPDGEPFTDDEDEVLADLARPLGLALHNVHLDSALQASLDELEARNAELQASRLRIVTTADESRRGIERDLHDGAQQHLVALAVKIGLIRQLLGVDRETAEALLDELRGDVQATLEELRELAHGIYPPLLRDRGLFEALRTAANRSPLAATVVADEVARYAPEVEAAVYFCCLEALQNAAKYAGEGASVTIALDEIDGALRFAVHDTGPGFDSAVAADGHGFANMRDRLGAIGGELAVTSVPGAGATVSGSIPLDLPGTGSARP